MRHYNTQRETAPGEGQAWRTRPLDLRPLTGMGMLGAFRGMGAAAVQEHEKFVEDVNQTARNVVAMARMMRAQQAAGQTVDAATLRAYSDLKIGLLNLLLDLCQNNPTARLRVPRELGLDASGARAQCFEVYDLPTAGLGFPPLVWAAIAAITLIPPAVIGVWRITSEDVAQADALRAASAVQAEAMRRCYESGGTNCQSLGPQPPPNTGDGIFDDIKGAVGWLLFGVVAVSVVPPLFRTFVKR